MNLQRLDKLVSSQFNVSRSIARKDILRGKVSVNGVTERDFSLKCDTQNAKITYNGHALEYKEHIYLIMNKPKGVLSASTDSNRETVVDLVPESLKRNGLFPVGRLDKDTTGLLLITDDGDFAHNIITPKKDIKKLYRVTVDGILNSDTVKQFQDGIVLADGKKCLPARLNILSDYIANVTICEGKYHQIKRMFGAVGLGVVELERLSIGGLSLPENLNIGECRELSANEKISIFC